MHSSHHERLEFAPAICFFFLLRLWSDHCHCDHRESKHRKIARENTSITRKRIILFNQKKKTRKKEYSTERKRKMKRKKPRASQPLKNKRTAWAVGRRMDVRIQRPTIAYTKRKTVFCPFSDRRTVETKHFEHTQKEKEESLWTPSPPIHRDGLNSSCLAE